MSRFLELFAQDQLDGTNFRSYLISIDVGREEFWTANIAWTTDRQLVSFYTEYNPPWGACRDDCDHFPRHHHDDLLDVKIDE